MKYGYLKKCLSISIVAAMIVTSHTTLLAEDLLTSGVEGTLDSGDSGYGGDLDSDYSGEYTEDEVDYADSGDEEYDDDEDEYDDDDDDDDDDDEDDDDEDDDDLEVEPEVTPVPEPSEAPSPEDPAVTPSPVTPAVTPAPAEPVITPDPSITPVPSEPTITPTPSVPSGEGELIDPDETIEPEPTKIPDDPEIIDEDGDDPEPTAKPTPTETPEEDETAETVEDIISRIDALLAASITLDDEDEIAAIRELYDSLSEEDKERISNYAAFLELEEMLEDLEDEEEETDGELEVDDGLVSAITGSPVYYTNMVSNLHAGKDFYLNSLKENYQLSFSDDFAEIMEDIETEYKEENHLVDKSDVDKTLTTTSADSLLVRNWQDILAIYVYEESKDGKTSYTLDKDSKDSLASIFAEMNPVVKSKDNPKRNAYGDRHINYYIKKNKIDKEDREILKKYVETDCKLLCAVVTAAKGFVRESVGDDVSEERVNVISAAFSLVGKVGYFWGGKSVELGEDPSWGEAEVVTAEGSNSTGTTRAYGLDCSGFVTWAVVNGYQDKEKQADIGDGTSEQWLNANVVSESDAQPGDLVFQKGPEAGQDNHVGILVGQTDAGDWIAVHCSSGKNGVTVGEAYGASFRYIRQPDFYPTEEEMEEMRSEDLTDGTEDDDIVTIDSGDQVSDLSGDDLTIGTVSDDDLDSSADSDEDLTVSDEDLPAAAEEESIDIETEPEILVDDSVVELF